VHFNISLLLYAKEHNDRNDCDEPLKKYLSKQSVPFVQPDLVATGEDGARDCEAPPHADVSRTKRRKKGSSLAGPYSCAREGCCDEACAAEETGSGAVSSLDMAEEVVPARQEPSDREWLASKRVIVNWMSKTVHRVVLGADRGVHFVVVRCSWIPPEGSKSLRTEELFGSDLFSCGTCFDKRKLLILD
jgi:hypothetical protein